MTDEGPIEGPRLQSSVALHMPLVRFRTQPAPASALADALALTDTLICTDASA